MKHYNGYTPGQNLNSYKASGYKGRFSINNLIPDIPGVSIPGTDLIEAIIQDMNFLKLIRYILWIATLIVLTYYGFLFEIVLRDALWSKKAITDKVLKNMEPLIVKKIDELTTPWEARFDEAITKINYLEANAKIIYYRPPKELLFRVNDGSKVYLKRKFTEMH